ncbi:hypothetical protein PanWU01x14_125640 [Parasponia andersonii]|uniref:Uncharacterized protein n=1 Tax=Parasponia andersonii TaxID=3476 RepID=A0A2P5CT74_PARAD|nr:hypothetical protein PanWU01x14_125640 [Parasponia andersonii]
MSINWIGDSLGWTDILILDKWSRCSSFDGAGREVQLEWAMGLAELALVARYRQRELIELLVEVTCRQISGRESHYRQRSFLVSLQG